MAGFPIWWEPGWATMVSAGVGLASVVGTYWNTYFAPGFEPDAIAARYAAHFGTPNVHPTPDAILDLWTRGWISDEQAVITMLYHGVPVRPIGPLAEVLQRLNQGAPGMGQLYTALLNRNPGQTRMWTAARDAHLGVPSAADCMRLLAHGLIGDEEWARRMRKAGANRVEWFGMLPMFHAVPPVEMLMAARNRMIIGPERFNSLLVRHGIGSLEDRQTIDRLRAVIPPVTDLIHFVVREAFTPELAEAQGLYEETPEDARRFAHQLGLFGRPGFQVTVGGAQRDVDWFDVYWAAHWQHLAPGQLYVMHQRIREDTVAELNQALDPTGTRGVNLQPFTIDDVRRGLRVADYPPAVRDYLAAIAFTPLRLVDVRRAYELGARDRDWVLKQLRNRGYSPADARAQADLFERQAQGRAEQVRFEVRRNLIRETVRSIRAAYREGILGTEEAVAQLAATGLGGVTARLALRAEDIRRRTSQWVQLRRVLLRDYIQGGLSRSELADMFQRWGLFEPRRSELLDEWDSFRRARAQGFTGPKLIDLVVRGLMPADEARRRLTMIGFADPDAMLLLAEAQQRILTNRARQMQAADRSRRAQARELERVIRQGQADTRGAQAALRTITPRDTVGRWLREGIVSPAWALRRLMGMGYDRPNALRYIRQWAGEAARANAETAPPPENGEAPAEQPPPAGPGEPGPAGGGAAP